MSRRIIEPSVLEPAGDLSADYISSIFGCVQTDNVGMHLIWTGTPTGQIFIDASIDGANWDSLDLSPIVALGGSAGSTLLNLQQVPYASLRVRYQRTSGSGSLKINVIAKQSGG